MTRQSQWLFEAPPALSGDRYPYANPESEWEWESPPVSYFNAPPNDREWEILWEFESSGGSTSEYPGASRFVPAAAGNYTKWYHSSPRPIRRIVIHITDGRPNISGPISWFQNPSAKVSAHYIVGQDGEVVQMVRENDIAHHASGANKDTIGIEHVANTRGLMPTPEQYRSSAALVRWLCQKYNLPMDRSHIMGHSEANPKTKHTGCPNAVWDWNYFMPLVTSGAGGPAPKQPPVYPSSPSSSLDIDRAVRLNYKYGQSLGWQSQVDSIVRLLGFTTYTPNEQVFAEAVARWQKQKGLPVDGIIGPNTWRQMQTGLGLAPTPSTPSNKIQQGGEIIYKSLFNQTFEPGIKISGITQFKPTCDLKDLILGATSAVEGSYDAVNMYDRGIISWGITQNTIHAGGLQNLLYFIRQQRPDVFERHFGSVGLGIQLLKGTAELFYRGQVIPVSQNRQLRTLFRGNPERGKFDRTTIEYWAKIFSRAGRDPEVQALQREFARKEIERILNKPHKLLQGKSPVNLLGNNYEAQALFYGMWINNHKNAYLHLDRAVKNAGGYRAGTSAIVAAFNSELDNSKFGEWPARAKKIRRVFNDLRKRCSI